MSLYTNLSNHLYIAQDTYCYQVTNSYWSMIWIWAKEDFQRRNHLCGDHMNMYTYGHPMYCLIIHVYYVRKRWCVGFRCITLRWPNFFLTPRSLCKIKPMFTLLVMWYVNIIVNHSCAMNAHVVFLISCNVNLINRNIHTNKDLTNSTKHKLLRKTNYGMYTHSYYGS